MMRRRTSVDVFLANAVI